MQTEETQEYFKNFETEVRKVYTVANEARKKGLDPVNKVEIPLAKTMAEKCVELIGTIYPQMSSCGIDERMIKLEEEYGKLDPTVAFKIAEEVAKQNFCKFNTTLEAIDAGIRLGFAYQTIGVVASPIEGYTHLELGKTRDGKEYFKAYFSGPIRSAGTTASCMVLVLIDYLRELFGYAKYDITEEEIKRYVTECYDYHERITNLQYIGLEEELAFLARNLPIQITGDPTEKFEVSNYKNLERVETNFIRGGMALIFSEGLAQKAAKGFRLYNRAKENGIEMTGFDWIPQYLELHEKLTSGKAKIIGDNVPVYIKDLVAGRPVFGHPSRSGAFRFRYGRGRNSGFSASSVHPATMAITDDFIAIGTQLKIEKPTKGCCTTVCDTIDGPIVKLFNGSVKKISTMEEARRLYPDVEEIIYLGDLLFPFSDLANRNANLIKPGYVEEWWGLDLKKENPELAKEINSFDVNFETAISVSKENRIPLHPNHIFYWTQISKEEFLNLIKWLKNSQGNKKIILPYYKTIQEKFAQGKRALELLGVEHELTTEHVIIDEDVSKTFLTNLGLDYRILESDTLFADLIDEDSFNQEKSVLEIINSVSKFEIKDKAGDFIGTRMGRPEKAKLRKLTGSPNVLFPVGREGGRLRSVQEASKVGTVRNTFPNYFCEKCNTETIYPTCESCGSITKKVYFCYECKRKSFEPCKEHNNSQFFGNRSIDMVHYFNDAISRLGISNGDIPPLIKGVRGTSSENHMTEHLSKGVLRARHNLQVNKDGTIRFDATELPLTSFKPKEIFVSVEKLRKLGYTKDIDGKELENNEQILELKPHDILLPAPSRGNDEKADSVFMNICNFIDELLEKFYGLERFYNIKTRDDLIGHLGVCMAPHNCAGVVCRIIGFSNTQGLLASPFMHAAIRRDCDGDEAAIMLLTDVLLNFSRTFLPSHRGGTQDAPLVLNAKIDAGEVDDQILDFEMVREYPIELYHLAEERKHSSEVNVYTIRDALKEGRDPFVGIGFTHDTSNFNKGVVCSSYKLLGTMQEKVQHQMELVEKIRAADTSDTARLVIERHFIKDMKGNLRKFTMQDFRCVRCNEIFRRPPLSGVCSKCGGKIIFTVNEGGIKKYLEPALNLAEKYDLSPYIRQNLELTKRYIDSLFGKELEKQEALKKWF